MATADGRFSFGLVYNTAGVKPGIAAVLGHAAHPCVRAGVPGRAGLLRRIKMIDGRTFGLASAGIVVAVARPSSSRAAGRRHHGRAPLPR